MIWFVVRTTAAGSCGDLAADYASQGSACVWQLEDQQHFCQPYYPHLHFHLHLRREMMSGAFEGVEAIHLLALYSTSVEEKVRDHR